jgi:ribosome maturation factor RimP
MRPEERNAAEAIIRELLLRQGYEALRLTISVARDVVLTLDREDRPITIQDCTVVNRAIRRNLEEAGLPADDYGIEVESPGVLRPLHTLRHFQRFIGERVYVRLARAAPDGTQAVKGTLQAVVGDTVVVDPALGPAFRLRLDEIESARLDPQY